ncbi:thiol reductant ABC exporter subunit CydD [Marinobacter sp. X15-166B]|uniref:thiol reductant ABC exporter subunit CydD n=1 Tax=Marinobacter sp. X15-166B TaxID=1897620 RepID=UPI00085C2134|nr:thiol reductant ABC exporter subunit CydD [Marinobacter sp. X15-166B]OEY67618.1 thiol reductant ABC exporter subunit CydD [Marinobacter sp. X15-166B]
MPPSAQQGARQWLRALASGNRFLVVSTVGAGLVAALATIAQMGILAHLVHQGVIARQPVSTLSPWFGGLVGAIALRALAQGIQAQLAAHSSHAIRARVRRQLLTAWHHQGPIKLKASSAAELASEWLDQVDALHGYFARFLPQMWLSLLVPLLVLLVVASLDWLAALFLLLSAPLIPVFMALVGMGAEQVNQRHFETLGRLAGQFLDKVRGLTTLNLFGGIPVATEALRTQSDAYRRITMKTLKIAFLSSAVLEFFSSVAIAIVAMYVGFGLLGYIRIGPSENLTLFSGLYVLLLAPEFFQPLRLLSQHYHDRAAALGAAQLLGNRTGSAQAVSPPATQSSTSTLDAAVNVLVLDRVSVGFATRPAVLTDVSMGIRRGESVALTGPSGSGKSTLLHLMAGFLPPDSGRVSGVNQQPFGWLGQSPFVVQGTWAENLRLVAPQANDATLFDALARVGLAPLVKARSAGIHSPVTESGGGLSGGQARRLSLARIFLGDFDLVLLDEPTAGLDAGSESVVITALQELHAAGKTLVFSTHHPQLLALADRVIDVREGQLHHA